MTDDDRLETALRDVGRHLDVPPPPDTAAAVRARIEAQPTTRKVRRRFRVVAVACAALVVAVSTAAAASPQVRAAVVSVLRFAGIDVHRGSGPVPSLSATAAPLPGEHIVDLATARSLSAFPIRLPSALGPPDEITVSDGTPPRVVSLIYRGGPGRPAAGKDGVALRIDEFDGRLSPVFEKIVYMGAGVPVSVGQSAGYWFPGPQEVIYIGRDGQEYAQTAHLAADTLVWQVGDVTLRIEAALTEDQALVIATGTR